MELPDITKPNPWVEIRESKKHGRGIFAKTDIPRHTLVCYYDGEDMTEEEMKKNKCSSIYILSHIENKNLFRVGYKNPKNEWGIGQIANDYIKPEINFDQMCAEDCNQEKIKLLYESYGIISSFQSTLQLNKNFWMRTTRDIKKDEEITNSYGYPYWLKMDMDNQKIVLFKFMLLCLLPTLQKFTEMEDKQADDILLNVLSLTNDKIKLLKIDENLKSKEKLIVLAKLLNMKQY